MGRFADMLADGLAHSLADPLPGPDETAASILGAAYIADYDARAGYWAYGTPPDVASAVNRGLLGAAADIAQGTATRRPHANTILGVDTWDFAAAATNAALSDTTIAPDIYSVGDAFAVILLIKQSAAPAALRSVCVPAKAGGISSWFFTAGGAIGFRAPSAGGTQDASFAFADTTAFHVVRGTHTGDVDLRQTLHIDGVSVVDQAIGAQSNSCDGFILGEWAGQVRTESDIARATIAVGATEAQLEELDAHYMRLAGI